MYITNLQQSVAIYILRKLSKSKEILMWQCLNAALILQFIKMQGLFIVYFSKVNRKGAHSAYVSKNISLLREISTFILATRDKK